MSAVQDGSATGGNERVRHVADECLQLHGGFEYMKESAAGRAFVDSRLVSIGGGSDETMIHYLGKMLDL